MTVIIKTAEDVYQKPHHAFRRDLRDAYKVDFSLLTFAQKQVEPLANLPLGYAIDMEGGYNTSGEDLATLMASPLIQTRKITGMSVSSRYGDSFRFTFNVRSSSLGSTVEVSGYDDPLKFEGLITQLEDRMRSLRPWYWPVFRLPVELALVIAILIGSMILAPRLFPETNPDLRVLVVGIPLLIMGKSARRLLFARVEFMEGLSKRYADRRAAWQKFIGVTVILGSAVAVAREWLMGGNP